MVCANPDLVVLVGDQLVVRAGALAEQYKALGGRFSIMESRIHRLTDAHSTFSATRETKCSQWVIRYGLTLRVVEMRA